VICKTNRSTGRCVPPVYVDGPPPQIRKERVGVTRTARTIFRLVRARRRLKRWPTLRQVRTMARFEGREPCSYELDPDANWMPAFAPEVAPGRPGLCFTTRRVAGVDEMVALPSGDGFSLLGGL